MNDVAKILIILFVLLLGASCASGVMLGGGLSGNQLLSHNTVDINSHNVTVTSNTATYAPTAITQPQPEDFDVFRALGILIAAAAAALVAMTALHGVLEYANR